jgi:hypothetical protein
MPTPINRKIWAGTSSERPTTGSPGDIWIVFAPQAAPELTMWDDYARDWVEWSSDELELLDGVVAGTSKAGRIVVLDSSSQIDTMHFADSTHGGVKSMYEDVTIATADVLTLNATPVVLTSAPGAANFIKFNGALIWYDYNSAAYAGIAAGENLEIEYETAGTAIATVETVGFLDQTADEFRWVEPGGAANNVDLVVDGTAVLNKKLQITINTAEIITGDSPLKIRTFYSIVPKAVA